MKKILGSQKLSGLIYLSLFFYSYSISADSKIVLMNVPFTTQAPTGNWNDLRQEDGCEETVSLMAVKWARGEEIRNKNEVEKEIIAISDYEQEKYKSFQYTSIADTAERILKGYFKFSNYLVKENIVIDDIKTDLYKGNLVIAHVNGIKLKNPFYKRPGPEWHCILIRGYDPETKEFITNDPGTRRGEGYRYHEIVIKNSLGDYPTGTYETTGGIRNKAVIVVRKDKAEKNMND